jgi:hypothetical protein
MPSLAEIKARLTRAYVRGPVTKVLLIQIRSGLAALFFGPGARPPAGLPSVIRYQDGLTQRELKVYWERTTTKDRPLLPGSAAALKLANDQMWGGASIVTDDFRPWIIAPGRPMGANQPSAAPVPPAKRDQFELFVETRSLELPFWTVPSQVSQCGCQSQANVRLQTLSIPVPADQQIQVQGVSYYQDGLAVGDRVRFSASVSGSVKATWIDQVVNASGDPTEQWALGGGLRPIPVSFLADHDNTIDITSEIIGPLPSGYPVGYAVSAIICLQLQAVGSKVNDTRQGAPRPLDLGDVIQTQFGTEYCVTNFNDAELLKAVEQVLDDGAFGVMHPLPGEP